MMEEVWKDVRQRVDCRCYCSYTKETMKTEPDWVCETCIKERGARIPEWHCPTWHKDKCGICGMEDWVTEPRDCGGTRYLLKLKINGDEGTKTNL